MSSGAWEAEAEAERGWPVDVAACSCFLISLLKLS